MKKLSIRLFIALGVVLSASLFGLLNGSSLAQSNNQPTGITVSPAIQRVSIPAEQAELPLTFQITNNRPVPQTIQLSTRDFNSLNETGGLLFVGSNPTQLQKKYGLAGWLSLPQQSVTIPPRQTATVTALLINQSSLSAGGHYGALMLTLAPTGAQSPGQNQVSLQPIASSLIFLTKQGGEVYRMNLTDAVNDHSLFKLPSQVNLRFRNEGNTHLVPRGLANLVDPDGTIVRKGVINEESAIVLPEKSRWLNVKLANVGLASKPGEYKLAIDYRYEGFDGFRRYESSFFVMTPAGIVVSLVVLAALTAIGVSFYRRRFFHIAYFYFKKVFGRLSKSIAKKAKARP